MRDKKRRFWQLVLILLLVFHCLTVFRVFKVKDILSGNTYVSDDHPIHAHRLAIHRQVLLSGEVVSYNPGFKAGFIDFILPPLKSSDLLLISVPLSFLPTDSIFSAYIVMMNLLLPYLVFLSARNFNLHHKAAVVSSGFAILLLHFSELTHQMNLSGVFSYVFSSFFSIYALSLAYQLASRPSKKRFAFFLLIVFWTLLMHIYSVFFLSIGFISLYLFKVNKKEKRAQAALIIYGIFLLAVAVYNRDLLAYWLNWHHPPAFHQSEGFATILGDLFDKPIQTLIFLLALAEILRRKKNVGGSWNLFLALSFGIAFFVSYFGSFLPPLDYFQPQRTLIPLSLLMSFPAAKTVFRKPGFISLGMKGISLGSFVYWVIVLVVIASLVTHLDKFKERYGAELTTQYPPEVNGLLSFLSNHTDRTGRILIEHSGYLSGFHYGGHTPIRFPEMINRDFAGNPYPDYASIEGAHLPEFSEGRLWNEEIEDLTVQEIKQILSDNNVRWIVVWSNQSKEVFGSNKSLFRLVGTAGQFEVYEYEVEPSYFFLGSGIVEASLNTISVSNASSPITGIKFTYSPLLESNPPLPVLKYRPSEFYPDVDVHNHLILILNGNVTSFTLKI